jgi:hypothetical protein
LKEIVEGSLGAFFDAESVLIEEAHVKHGLSFFKLVPVNDVRGTCFSFDKVKMLDDFF